MSFRFHIHDVSKVSIIVAGVERRKAIVQAADDEAKHGMRLRYEFPHMSVLASFGENLASTSKMLIIRSDVNLDMHKFSLRSALDTVPSLRCGHQHNSWFQARHL